ncbi:hypothetical protein H696_00770 [Fonticula alba]|uniref:30S ribosomal protein S9 n=1 Tax=Fonticula alba TaxID=691883 RepID=A0A058ZH16_FONAL|nr:hypothetical protein H696_00770 [Fonticula alba]KCV73228.1 hypothetical protein H696_00770 [Fonticula alba]|eukprot:XP_009492929.1 hypothetical protein H696_00770 [Fonticula alba]
MLTMRTSLSRAFAHRSPTSPLLRGFSTAVTGGDSSSNEPPAPPASDAAEPPLDTTPPQEVATTDVPPETYSTFSDSLSQHLDSLQAANVQGSTGQRDTDILRYREPMARRLQKTASEAVASTYSELIDAPQLAGRELDDRQLRELTARALMALRDAGRLPPDAPAWLQEMTYDGHAGLRVAQFVSEKDRPLAGVIVPPAPDHNAPGPVLEFLADLLKQPHWAGAAEFELYVADAPALTDPFRNRLLVVPTFHTGLDYQVDDTGRKFQYRTFNYIAENGKMVTLKNIPVYLREENPSDRTMQVNNIISIDRDSVPTTGTFFKQPDWEAYADKTSNTVDRLINAVVPNPDSMVTYPHERSLINMMQQERPDIQNEDMDESAIKRDPRHRLPTLKKDSRTDRRKGGRGGRDGNNSDDDYNIIATDLAASAPEDPASANPHLHFGPGVDLTGIPEENLEGVVLPSGTGRLRADRMSTLGDPMARLAKGQHLHRAGNDIEAAIEMGRAAIGVGPDVDLVERSGSDDEDDEDDDDDDDGHDGHDFHGPGSRQGPSKSVQPHDLKGNRYDPVLEMVKQHPDVILSPHEKLSTMVEQLQADSADQIRHDPENRTLLAFLNSTEGTVNRFRSYEVVIGSPASTTFYSGNSRLLEFVAFLDDCISFMNDVRDTKRYLRNRPSIFNRSQPIETEAVSLRAYLSSVDTMRRKNAALARQIIRRRNDLEPFSSELSTMRMNDRYNQALSLIGELEASGLDGPRNFSQHTVKLSLDDIANGGAASKTPHRWVDAKFIEAVFGFTINEFHFGNIISRLTQLENLLKDVEGVDSIRNILNVFRKPVPPTTPPKTKSPDLEKGITSHGRHKRSRATVLLRPGEGLIWVNYRPLNEAFGHFGFTTKYFVDPFYFTNTLGMFDVMCNVRGGGLSSQAKACRLAISKALINLVPGARDVLKDQFAWSVSSFTRKERKKAGRAKARKSFTWVKR